MSTARPSSLASRRDSALVDKILSDFRHSQMSRRTSLALDTTRCPSSVREPFTQIFSHNSAQLPRPETQVKPIRSKILEQQQVAAIKNFYDKEYAKCFSILESLQNTLKQEKVHFPQHFVYVHYLRLEFMHKIKDPRFQISLNRALTALEQLQEKRSNKASEYILCIKALEAAFKMETGEFKMGLKIANQCLETTCISQKPSRPVQQLIFVKVSALQRLGQYKQLLAFIPTMEGLQLVDNDQCIQLKVRCFCGLGKNLEGALLLESILLDKEKTNSDLWERCISLFEAAGDWIHCLKLCNEWRKLNNPKGLNRRLFQIYCELGDLTSARSCIDWELKDSTEAQFRRLLDLYRDCGEKDLAQAVMQQIAKRNVVEVKEGFNKKESIQIVSINTQMQRSVERKKGNISNIGVAPWDLSGKPVEGGLTQRTRVWDEIDSVTFDINTNKVPQTNKSEALSASKVGSIRYLSRTQEKLSKN